ncbi:MAG: 50S ribosomal protein L4 [Candidatus Saccharibacteria bacterium]
MTKATVYNQTGEKVSEMDLNPKVFGIEKIDANLVHAAVRSQRSGLRKANAHTKNRGEVSGSGKKPWKQKGTGRARAGSIRSPLWKGGGITFGPRNTRNYEVKINQSAFRKAIFTILTDKFNDGKLAVIDSIEATAKTAEIAKRLKGIATHAGLGAKYVLIIDKPNAELTKAMRNLKNAKLLTANRLNVLDLLKFDLIATKESLPVIEKTYLK